MTSLVRALSAAAVVLLAGLTVGLLGVGPAAADDYQMRITPTALSPSSLTIHPVDRVIFTNSTGNTWRVQVGSGYDVVLFPGQSADGTGLDPDPYVATAAGTYHVVASSASAGNNLSATITVRSGSTTSPPPASSSPPQPAPKPSSSHPTAPVSSAPAPAASAASSSPQSSASPSASRSASPGAAATSTPSRSSPGQSSTPRPAAVLPVTSPAPSPSAQALSGPVQNIDGSGVGLPGAVGSVLVAGLIAALVRVLLAEPVDAPSR